MLPTLRTLQATWPDCRITWIIGKTEAGLVDDIDGVEFIIFDKNRGIKAFFDLRKKLRGQSFDLLLNMQVSPRAALASLFINAPLRVGYDTERGKLLHNMVCNRKIPHTANQHVLDSFLEFPKLLGITTPTIKWDIPIPPEAQESINKLLGENKHFIVINPSTSNRARNWRNWNSQRYAAVIDHVASQYGVMTVLTGGSNLQETIYADQIGSIAKYKPLNLVGKTNLKELAALCKGARVMISPDTGPAHIANAVGTPVIGLYASSNPERTGPYSRRNLTVNRYPDALKSEIGKAVAEVKWGQRVRNPRAMELIEIKEVLEKLGRFMESENQDSANNS